MRMISFVLSLVSASIAIWQSVSVGFYWLVGILAILSGSLLIAALLPVLKWGWHMLRTVWRAWRHPDKFLYIWDLNVNLLPQPSEPGEGFMWICGFEVVSLFPWDKIICFELEIREPSELAGTKGYLTNKKIKELSSTNVGLHRYPMSRQVYESLVRIKKASSFLPMRILINGRDNKGKHLLNQSVNYVVHW